MSGNKARALALAAINGLGLEGAGVLAPGNLSPDFIQATRDQSQGGFGAYVMPSAQTDIVTLDGVQGSTSLVTRGIFSGSQGFENRDLETRIIGSSVQLVLDAAGAAALVAAGARVEVNFQVGYNNGVSVVFATILTLTAPFISGQLSYLWTIHGGGLVVPAAGDFRMTGSFQGWVPALASSQWSVRSSNIVFPANSQIFTTNLVVQQPRFNSVPL